MKWESRESRESRNFWTPAPCFRGDMLRESDGYEDFLRTQHVCADLCDVSRLDPSTDESVAHVEGGDLRGSIRVDILDEHHHIRQASPPDIGRPESPVRPCGE